MKPRTDLYQLIKSLNKAEKRYFKLYSSIQSGEKLYLKLFDAIDRQQQYDEHALKSLFPTGQSASKFGRYKHYLYELILKSMRNYYISESVNAKLKGLLLDIQFLYHKRMYDQCKYMIQKAKKIAIDSEQFTYLIELLDWEIELMRVTFFIHYAEGDITSVYEQIQLAVSKLQNTHQYGMLSALIFVRFGKDGFPRSAQVLQQFNDLPGFQLLQKQSTETQIAKLHYLVCKGILSFMENKHANSISYSLEMIDLMEKSPYLIQEFITYYMAALNNLSHYQLFQGQFAEVLNNVLKLRNIQTPHQTLKHELAIIADNMELSFLIATEQFEMGKELAETIENKRSKFQSYTYIIRFERQMTYKTAYIYFALHYYKDSLNNLNKLLNNNDVDIRSDIYCFALILRLIVFYELKKDQLLPYAIKATFRYLSKKEQLYQFEKCILQFIKNLTTIQSKHAATLEFISLKTKLEDVFSDEYEKNVLLQINIIPWLNNKIQNPQFRSIVAN